MIKCPFLNCGSTDIHVVNDKRTCLACGRTFWKDTRKQVSKTDTGNECPKRTYDKGQIISLLGEGFHTAFRKGVPDSEIGHKIWLLISEMPREEWGAVLEWVYWSMGPEYADAFRVVTKSDKNDT